MPALVDLSDRTILVTGASSGIGRQCSITCAKLGARVIAWARDPTRLQETLSCLAGDGHRAVSQDLLDTDAIARSFGLYFGDSGPIHGLIHAAGMQMSVPLRVMKSEHYLNLFKLNALAGFELARLLSNRKYVSSDGSSFVFISSIAGICGQPALSGYAASKGALASGCRALAAELAPRKIRVNWISAGHVSGTAMDAEKERSLTPEALEQIRRSHPLGLGATSDVANACAFLLSDAARWITGSNMVVDGGYSSV